MKNILRATTAATALLLFLALLLLFLGLPAERAAADIVANGSFEAVSPPTLPTDPDPVIDQWTLVLGARSAESSAYLGDSPYGKRLLSFLSQPLNVGFGSATQDLLVPPPAGTYRVSFAFAQFGGAPNTRTLGVTVNVGSATILQQLYMDDSPASELTTGWKRRSFTFTTAGIITGITFADMLLSSGSDLIVDDVSIVAVPEATPLWLLTGALASAAAVAFGPSRRRLARAMPSSASA